jgi:hypothetical protein
LRGETLYLDLLTSLTSLEMLENFLSSDGPWIAGMDLPFGQPRPLIEALGWPLTWEGYVRTVSEMQIGEFEAALVSQGPCSSVRPDDRLRTTDRLARAQCRMVGERRAGEMFFYGAPRLLDADVSVLPCRESEAERMLVEALPALVAHKVMGPRLYKSDTVGSDDTTRATARRALLAGLEAEQFQHDYGFSVSIQEAVSEELAADHSADALDALLVAVQAAWAWTQRDHHYGIPRGVDSLEGWIADPALQALACGEP